MLGVRQSTIVASFKQLSALGALKQGHGRIIISARAVLKTQACECYGKIAQHMDPHPEVCSTTAGFGPKTWLVLDLSDDGLAISCELENRLSGLFDLHLGERRAQLEA